MNMPQVLILVTILVLAADAFPSDGSAGPGRDKRASWDDMNLLAHGLLQLGQGLKEHVDKTRGQMRDVDAKLKAINGSLAELQRAQRESHGAMEARTKELEEEEREEEEEVKTQSEDIHARMDRLEEKVDEVLGESTGEHNNSDHTGAPSIQALVVAQNRRIDQLVEKIRQQQDKLEKQSRHLQTLQLKVAHKRVKSHRRRDGDTALRAESGGHAPGLATDCHDLFLRGHRAGGVYKIQPLGSVPFDALCEMTSAGGWTVIQKRRDGSQSFNQLWESYRSGFGSLDGEFWLGLENIRSIAAQGQYVLQVELSDWLGQRREVRYGLHLEGEEKQFALRLEAESPSGAREHVMGTEGSGVPFSTADRDNDLSEVNCAARLSGGWWFSRCGESNLNGIFPRRPSVRRSSRREMFWSSTKGRLDSLKTTLLKIAPATIKHEQ